MLLLIDVSILFNNSLIILISNISFTDDFSLSESDAKLDSYESIDIVEFSFD